MDAFDKPPDEVVPLLLQGAVPLPRGLCSVLRPLLISIAGLDTLSGGLNPANAGSESWLTQYLKKWGVQQKNMRMLKGVAALAQRNHGGGKCQVQRTGLSSGYAAAVSSVQGHDQSGACTRGSARRQARLSEQVC